MYSQLFYTSINIFHYNKSEFWQYELVSIRPHRVIYQQSDRFF